VKVRCGTEPGLEHIRANGVMSFRPGACGLAVRCLSGVMVVTQKGDHKDHELFPGEGFRTTRQGLVVVWALADSACSVMDGASVSEPRLAA
jgi:hypothetical protein